MAIEIKKYVYYCEVCKRRTRVNTAMPRISPRYQAWIEHNERAKSDGRGCIVCWSCYKNEKPREELKFNKKFIK